MSDELFDYIAEARRRGMTHEQIRQALLKSGWDQTKVKTSFNQYYYVNPGDAPKDHEESDETKTVDGLAETLGSLAVAADDDGGHPAAMAAVGSNDSDAPAQGDGPWSKIEDDELRLGGQKVKVSQLPIIAVGFIAAGVFLTWVGFSSYREDKSFVERAESVAGTVVRIESGKYDPMSYKTEESLFSHPDLWLARGKTLYKPVVEIELEGRGKLEVGGKWRRSPDYYSVNQRVEVLYDPEDVSDRRINSEDEIGDFSHSLVWFGAALVSVGTLLWRGERSGTLFFGAAGRRRGRSVLDV